MKWLCSHSSDFLFYFILFRFDGEFINLKETAEDLALEGGEVMDFFQKK